MKKFKTPDNKFNRRHIRPLYRNYRTLQNIAERKSGKLKY